MSRLSWNELHRSRGADASELCWKIRPSDNKGAGKAGCPPHPRPPCIKKHGEGTTGEDGAIRPSLRDGFTAYTALSSGTGLYCPRRHAKPGFAQLDASVGAPGPHGFAVRGSFARLATLSRPPHLRSNVRDDRAAPLMRAGMAG